jgi:hypothetical protein
VTITSASAPCSASSLHGTSSRSARSP